MTVTKQDGAVDVVVINRHASDLRRTIDGYGDDDDAGEK